MINLFNYFLESNIVLLMFSLVYYSLIAKQPHFQFRRIYILLAVTCSLAIPFVSINIGGDIISGALFSSEITTIMLDEVVIGGGLDKPIYFLLDQHWSFYVLASYLLICLIFLVGFTNQLFSIFKIFKNKTASLSKHKDYILIEVSKKYPTFSFFKYLILSNGQHITEKERKQIIAHEKVHIRQWHSVDVLLLESLRVLFWINPAVWFFRKTQVENHEYIVDQQILAHHNRSEYQQLLVKMTVDQMKLVGNYFAKIHTLKRIDMMNEERRKPSWLKLTTATLCSLLIVVTLACNEELVEVAQSAEMVLELPAEAQEAMDKLKKKHPNEKFVYVEFDKPQEGLNIDNIIESKGIEFKTIQSVVVVKERNKIGLILATSEDFHRLAEFTKNKNETGYEVFDIVEDQPAPIGGMAEFYKYIGINMKYPSQARSIGIEGRVFIQFIVDKEGNLTNITSVKGIGAGCDQEAVRVLENAPKWTPGKQRGKAVNVRMILPITFKLDDTETTLSIEQKKSIELKRAAELKAAQL